MHIPDLCFAVFIFHGKLYVNTYSVELLAGGVHAMNNVVLTKWHIALSINIGALSINIRVLENH